MNEVVFAQVLESACDLLEEVASQDFVQSTIGRVRVSVEDVVCLWQTSNPGSTLHERSQIRHLTVFHDKMDVLRGINTLKQGNNVRVLQLSQDVDLGVEILPQLSGKLSCDDGFDGSVRLALL